MGWKKGLFSNRCWRPHLPLFFWDFGVKHAMVVHILKNTWSWFPGCQTLFFRLIFLVSVSVARRHSTIIQFWSPALTPVASLATGNFEPSEENFRLTAAQRKSAWTKLATQNEWIMMFFRKFKLFWEKSGCFFLVFHIFIGHSLFLTMHGFLFFF